MCKERSMQDHGTKRQVKPVPIRALAANFGFFAVGIRTFEYFFRAICLRSLLQIPRIQANSILYLP
jgi:hypothetical protein